MKPALCNDCGVILFLDPKQWDEYCEAEGLWPCSECGQTNVCWDKCCV